MDSAFFERYREITKEFEKVSFWTRAWGILLFWASVTSEKRWKLCSAFVFCIFEKNGGVVGIMHYENIKQFERVSFENTQNSARGPLVLRTRLILPKVWKLK